MRKIISLHIVVILALIISSNSFININAESSGSIYMSNTSYQFNEIVFIYISTPTGINDTRVEVYLPNGLVNRYNIGELEPGVWQFPLGGAGHIEGQRIVVLLDGSIQLSNTFYLVVEATPTDTTTIYKMHTRYRTSTTYSTSTRTATLTKITTDFSTSTRYKTKFNTLTTSTTLFHKIVEYHTTTISSSYTQYQTTLKTELEINTTLSTITVPLPSFTDYTAILLILLVILGISLLLSLIRNIHGK
jgi:hypothetical protein